MEKWCIKKFWKVRRGTLGHDLISVFCFQCNVNPLEIISGILKGYNSHFKNCVYVCVYVCVCIYICTWVCVHVYRYLKKEVLTVCYGYRTWAKRLCMSRTYSSLLGHLFNSVIHIFFKDCYGCGIRGSLIHPRER